MCLGKVNMLKSVLGSTWGADRVVLIKFYLSLIRSKLDYGSIFYATASRTSLEALDRVQNASLRIALGVWRTTPILSLEAESDIPPLFIHRQLTLFQYWARLTKLPNSLPVVRDLFGDFEKLRLVQWSYPARVPPLIVRSRRLLVLHKYPCEVSPSVSLLSPCPPWTAINEFFSCDFSEIPVKYMSNSTANNLYSYLLKTEYRNFLAIFTDGSLIRDPEVSVGAGVVVHRGTGYTTFSWRLPKYTSILGAELFSIYQSLLYLKVNHTNSVRGGCSFL